MTDTSFAITLVHGTEATAQTDALAARFGRRVITTPDDAQDGDVLALESLAGLTWIASNVLLLTGNRAPIVRILTLSEALGV